MVDRKECSPVWKSVDMNLTLGISRKEPLGDGKSVHYFQKKRKKQHSCWKQNICSSMHIYIRGFSSGMLGRLHHYSILEYQIISRVSDKLPVAATLFQSSGGSFDTQHRPSMEVPPAKMATAYDKCVLYVQVKVCRCHQKKWGLCNMCKLCYVGVTERNGDTESATSYSNQLFYSPDHVFN